MSAESDRLVGWEQLLDQAVGAVTTVARLRRSVTNADGGLTLGQYDVAEFITQVVAGAAANVGGLEELLAGRSGSWEADLVRTMLGATVGDEARLWEYRTEPLRVVVYAALLLEEAGLGWEHYEESQRWVRDQVDGLGLVFDVMGEDGQLVPTDSDAAPLDPETAARTKAEWAPWTATVEWRCQREGTPEQEAQLDRLAELEEAIETLRLSDVRDYGETFAARFVHALSEAGVAPEAVAIEIVTDDLLYPDGVLDAIEGCPPLAHPMFETARASTPLPGSDIAPQDYPTGQRVRDVERTAGRLSHQRLGWDADA